MRQTERLVRSCSRQTIADKAILITWHGQAVGHLREDAGGESQGNRAGVASPARQDPDITGAEDAPHDAAEIGITLIRSSQYIAFAGLSQPQSAHMRSC